MSWDDEDFEIPTSTAPAASWEDDADVAESWEAEAEEAPKKTEPKKPEPKKAAPKAKKNAKAGEKKLMEIDLVDEKTRKEMLRQAELSADLNNAADLFGGLGVASDLEDVNKHPREKLASQLRPVLTADTPLQQHPLFQPENKADFEKLRKALGPALTKLADEQLMAYASGLAIDLIRDLVQPLSVENLRKVISTLTVAQKEKERQERQARLSKTGGTATGGAGKKKAKPLVKANVNAPSFKKTDYEEDFDDFGDDDFM